ncbi:MAG: hypothetical protein IKN25_03495, partial [Spirochaetales bacterium]|nr:hypothetical protein [Spirochaetales bacterium]
NQSDEIYTLNHRIKDLEKKLQKKEKTEYDGSYHLQIPCDVSENYPCEIKDYLYRVLYDVIETDKNNLPNNETGSRKKDILNSLTKSKTFDWEKTETYSKISEIEKIMKGNKRPNIDKLCRVGFVEKERSGDHVKCLFYDIPYPIVFSLSPSDYRNADNMMVNIKQQCFLV